MTVPTHTIPVDLLDGLRRGDDQALEHGFRELYPALAKEAADEFGDPSASGRIVERAFLRLWELREAIADADGLDLALRSALHESAIRERSRRAAINRFEHNEGVTSKTPHADLSAADVDQAWVRIQRALHRPEHASADTLASQSAEAKHRAAVHMAGAVNRRNRWTIPAVVVGVVAVCAGAYGVSRIDTGPNEAEIQRALTSADASVLNAGPGQIGSVTMADETQLKLAPGSTLHTPREFGTSIRTVSLSGTAAFTVIAGAQPFGLRANGIALSLASGKVDVFAEADAPTVVRVREGQARATFGDSSWTVAAGQSFILESNKSIRAATAPELDQAFSWIDGRFVAVGTLAHVVATLNKWYGADVGVGDGSIMTRPASATGSLDSLMTTIRSLEKSTKLQMRWTNGRMLLFKNGG